MEGTPPLRGGVPSILDFEFEFYFEFDFDFYIFNKETPDYENYENAEGRRVTITAAGAGASAVVTITDTGCGIPPEHLPRVFERFYKASSSRESN